MRGADIRSAADASHAAQPHGGRVGSRARIGLRSLSGMSLRARLILGVLLLVTVAILAVSIITFLALREFLIDRVDRQLVGTPPALVGHACAGELGGNGPPPVPLLVGRLNADGTIALCDPTGYVRPLRLSDENVWRLVHSMGRPVTLRQPDGQVRAVAHRARDDAIDVTALSLEDVEITLDRLLTLEVAIGATALILAGTAGVLGVGRGLRPLAAVTATARAVAGEVSPDEARSASAASRAETGGLRRRVPAGAPGTEVGELAAAFNTMLTAVETEVAGRQASEQRMRQFLADASHELRTPLTSLRGYADLIIMRECHARVDRDPESADALRRISDEGARMSRLIDDLLVLARSDADPSGGPRHDESVALDELAADAVADLRAAHPTRYVALDAASGSIVRGDRDQLRQVLANLLTNAAVHTDGDVRVTVSRRDGEIQVSVADDGPGLSPPQAAHAFDRFWRADSARTRARGGSGLGLSIVDTLVHKHGGRIDFDTSPAAGTTVTICLPLAR